MNYQAPFYYYYYPQVQQPRVSYSPSFQGYYQTPAPTVYPKPVSYSSTPNGYYPYAPIRNTSSLYQPAVVNSVSQAPLMSYSYILSRTTAQETQAKLLKTEEIEEIKCSLLSGEEASTEFQKIIANLQGPNKDKNKFVDIDFPPNFKSLVGENAEKKKDWINYCWLRPEEFMNTAEPILPIVRKIEPNDIKQGNLNDSYLLSVLASIAEQPDRIKNMLNLSLPGQSEEEVTELCHKLGVYCIKFYEMGVPIEVVIDDTFPTIPKENFITAFTRTYQNELWSLLIEKAWAKCYGSYADVEWGWARHSLRDFVPAPTKAVWTDEENLWENILKGEERNWIMTTGSFSSKCLDEKQKRDDEYTTEDGIATAQVYSLLSGIEFEDGELGKVRLVKLRDSHGKIEWKGKWSDNSEEYKRIPEQFIEEGTDKDGTFFMELNDFKKYFENAHFCMVDDSFKYSYLQTKATKKDTMCFEVKLPQKGKYFFSVMQKNVKKYPKKIQENFDYAQVTMVIAKKIGDKYGYIKGVFRSNYEVWTCKGEEEEIEAGVYFVMVKCAWLPEHENQFTLSVYGIEEAEIKQVDKQNEFLEKVYLNYANTVCKNVKPVEGVEDCVVRDEITADGYGFVSLHNKNKEKKVKCQVKFVNLDQNKLKIKGKEADREKRELVLEPNSEKVLLLRMTGYADEKTTFYEVKACYSE